MVLDTVEHADRRPNSPTPASKLATILIQLTTSFGSEQDPQVVGMQGIRPLSNDHEISPGVRRLLESSLTPTTIRGYRTASQRRRGYDPFKLPTNQIWNTSRISLRRRSLTPRSTRQCPHYPSTWKEEKECESENYLTSLDYAEELRGCIPINHVIIVHGIYTKCSFTLET